MDDSRRGGGRRPGHGRPVIPAKRSADTQEAQWVAQEDIFVLKQAKKKAEIRVKDGRARPIDWLAVTLRLIDLERDPLDDEMADADLEVVDPEGVFEGLSEDQIAELEKDIDTYIALEVKRDNRDYWMTMKVICQDRRRDPGGNAPETRAVSSVAADVDKLLGPKTFEQLEVLEKQIMRKLDSNEPIDVDYWEQLLRSLTVWKAKARLKRVYQSVIDARLQKLRKQQAEEAELVREKLQTILRGAETLPDGARTGDSVDYSPILDPEGQLRIRPEDKGLEIIDEKDFLDQVVIERRRTSKMGYIPRTPRTSERPPAALASKSRAVTQVDPLRFSGVHNHDFSQATNALFEREVARGVGEDEEIFTGEEELSGTAKPQWAAKHRPRKPRYFNRVQMGYEWNKYNQTHYDHDNPPPKVVQGYKFNIFYPDLIDKTKAPTYKIHREHGRKRGQSFAPAGEEDTCLIRFVAGPPYEDVAFRIVDKEWDYSAKRERGFKSSFDKGILQLHFQFKKIYYRK